jgi:hypothetical protein
VVIILGLDPGESSGWSTWYYDAMTPPRPIAHGTITGGVVGFVDWWGDGGAWDEVVSESFVLDGRTPFPNTMPLKIEGALAVLWPDTIFQRNTFKSHMPDQKIKDLGLWWPGAGHDRDSLRHVWALMKVRKHMPTLKLWPPRTPVELNVSQFENTF